MLVSEENTKSYDSITFEWVKNAIASFGWYIIEDDGEGLGVGKSDKRVDMVILLDGLKDRRISLVWGFRVNKQFRKKINELLELINNANRMNSRTKFVLAPSEGGVIDVCVGADIYVCEKISAKDVVEYMELFIIETNYIVKESSLSDCLEKQ